nr:unnamed protein product [Haemonchus contortus]
MEQRGLFDFSLKRTDESYSSDSEASLSEGWYSDDDDAATQGKATQQEALVYAEQYEKSYEKAQERKKLYQALEKELKCLLHRIREVLVQQDQASPLQAVILHGRQPQTFVKRPE